MTTANDLETFYGSIDPDQSLTPDSEFYVNFVAEDPTGYDPISEIAARIRLSSSQSVSLVTGQRGTGKSTELARLKVELEKQDCEVFLSDMRQYMNLNTPVEIGDFMFSIFGALSDEIETRLGANPGNAGYKERFWNWLQSSVEIDKFAVEGGGASLELSLKTDPTFKHLMQEALKGHASRLIENAHLFAAEAVTLVREKWGNPDKKVVYIIDTLEQIRGVGADGARAVYESVENLFSGHASALQVPMLHIVYTIPPYLQTLAPGIGRHLGGDALRSLPNVHVFKKDGSPDPAGLDIMKRITSKRFNAWEEILTDDQICRLATYSGGDIRDFFRLLKLCLLKTIVRPSKDLRISDTTIESAAEDLRRELLPIASHDLNRLRDIHTTKNHGLEEITDLWTLARYFDTDLLRNYRNGHDWYDINPLLFSLLGEEAACARE